MRDSRYHYSPPSSTTDKGFTFIVMLLSLIVIILLYSIVGGSHQVHHHQGQKEILYTLDNNIMPPVNTSLTPEDANKAKEKEKYDQIHSIYNKMKQSETMFDNYLTNGKKIFKYSGKRQFLSFTSETLTEKYSKKNDGNNNVGSAEGSSSSGSGGGGSANGNGNSALNCGNWGVITTNHGPTTSVEKFLTLNKWCLVIVGDQKGVKTYTPNSPNQPPPSTTEERNTSERNTANSNYVYLSYDEQVSSFVTKFPILANLPANHVSRKNLGYLYAIQHGATMIYDFDDDYSIVSSKHGNNNIFRDGYFQYRSSLNNGGEARRETKDRRRSLKGHHKRRSLQGESGSASQSASLSGLYLNANEVLGYNHTYLNTFPLLGSSVRPSWPRGFPINYLKETEVLMESNNSAQSWNFQKRELPKESVGIIHFVANHYPDVDIIYKMILSLPLQFPFKNQVPFLLPLSFTGSAIPSSTSAPANAIYAPYNSKSTMFFNSLLWSLYLPISINNHMIDIFRAYITERILFEINRLYAIAAEKEQQQQQQQQSLQKVGTDLSQVPKKELRILFNSPISIHNHIDVYNNYEDPSFRANGNSNNNNNINNNNDGASSNPPSPLRLKIDNLDFVQSYSKEYQLYLIINVLVDELQSYSFRSQTIPGLLEEIYIYLYEIGIVDKSEVLGIQQWIQQLLDFNYVFPTLPVITTPSSPTAAAVEEAKKEEIKKQEAAESLIN